jgi:hypothetical protein
VTLDDALEVRSSTEVRRRVVDDEEAVDGGTP